MKIHLNRSNDAVLIFVSNESGHPFSIDRAIVLGGHIRTLFHREVFIMSHVTSMAADVIELLKNIRQPLDSNID